MLISVSEHLDSDFPGQSSFTSHSNNQESSDSSLTVSKTSDHHLNSLFSFALVFVVSLQIHVYVSN